MDGVARQQGEVASGLARLESGAKELRRAQEDPNPSLNPKLNPNPNPRTLTLTRRAQEEAAAEAAAQAVLVFRGGEEAAAAKAEAKAEP